MKKLTKIRVLIILSGLVIGVVVSITFSSSIYKVDAIITQNQLILLSLRWVLLITFYSFWPGFVNYRAKQKAWQQSKRRYWLKQRVRVMIWLIVFEILIGENALGWIL